MELYGHGEGGREKRLVMAAAELAHMFRTLDLQGWLSGSRLTDVTPESQRNAALTPLTELWGIARGDTLSAVFFGNGLRTENATVPILPEVRRTVIGALVGTSQERSSDLSQYGEAGAARLASQVAHYMRDVVVEKGTENIAEITVLPPDPTLFVLPVSPEST
jgi:hypothetical protein